jgi:glycosyltransferase involved in cell wall biosynthesis
MQQRPSGTSAGYAAEVPESFERRTTTGPKSTSTPGSSAATGRCSRDCSTVTSASARVLGERCCVGTQPSPGCRAPSSRTATIGRRTEEASTAWLLVTNSGFAEDVTLLCFLGRIRPYKNVAALVRAFRDLPGDHLRLLVTGEPEPERIMSEIHHAAGPTTGFCCDLASWPTSRSR